MSALSSISDALRAAWHAQMGARTSRGRLSSWQRVPTTRDETGPSRRGEHNRGQETALEEGYSASVRGPKDAVMHGPWRRAAHAGRGGGAGHSPPMTAGGIQTCSHRIT